MECWCGGNGFFVQLGCPVPVLDLGQVLHQPDRVQVAGLDLVPGRQELVEAQDEGRVALEKLFDALDDDFHVDGPAPEVVHDLQELVVHLRLLALDTIQVPQRILDLWQHIPDIFARVCGCVVLCCVVLCCVV